MFCLPHSILEIYVLSSFVSSASFVCEIPLTLRKETNIEPMIAKSICSPSYISIIYFRDLLVN